MDLRIKDLFSGIDDPRMDRTKKHPLEGSVASVSYGYDFVEDRVFLGALRHQIFKIVERREGSLLTDNLSFLNHANIFNS